MRHVLRVLLLMISKHPKRLLGEIVCLPGLCCVCPYGPNSTAWSLALSLLSLLPSCSACSNKLAKVVWVNGKFIRLESRSTTEIQSLPVKNENYNLRENFLNKIICTKNMQMILLIFLRKAIFKWVVVDWRLGDKVDLESGVQGVVLIDLLFKKSRQNCLPVLSEIGYCLGLYKTFWKNKNKSTVLSFVLSTVRNGLIVNYDAAICDYSWVLRATWSSVELFFGDRFPYSDF